MNEERRMILEMLKENAITVEEAERLLEALNNEKEESELTVIKPGQTGFDPKRIVVLVTEEGKQKANIKLPFSLVRTALKIGKTVAGIGGKYSPENAEALEMLQHIDIDEILENLSDGEISLPYTMVDAHDDDKGQHVQIVLE